MAGSTSETPVADLLASMTADSIEASSLDAETPCSFASPCLPQSMPPRSRTC